MNIGKWQLHLRHSGLGIVYCLVFHGNLFQAGYAHIGPDYLANILTEANRFTDGGYLQSKLVKLGELRFGLVFLAAFRHCFKTSITVAFK